MTHPTKEDFADDKTVGASNKKETYNDENTVATADLSEESISSSEESSDEEEDENDYSPPNKHSKMPNKNHHANKK